MFLSNFWIFFIPKLYPIGTIFYQLHIFYTLKGTNFSLFKDPKLGYNLSPAYYDMLAAELLVEGADEELALTLNGKKKKIKRGDFEQAINHFDIDKKSFENIFKRFQKAIPKWHDFIQLGFLPETMKESYRQLIERKAVQLDL